MITKEEFEQMTEMQSKRFIITQKKNSLLKTDYIVYIFKTDVYSVGITRKTYDDKDYEFTRNAVDRVVIESYEELEWLIKATMRYDKQEAKNRT